MYTRNQFKIRHYVVGSLGVIGLIGSIISLVTGRMSAASPMEQLISDIVYPISFLFLIACVISYSLNKELLSKLFATLGLGIIAVLIIIGSILYTIAGDVSFLPYILIVVVLLAIALLIWLFLRK